MGKIWFTADTHFGHVNIVRGVSEWQRSTRDFDTVEEHDFAILSAIQKYVLPGDTLYHLGDVCMGDKNKLMEYVNAFGTADVHLIVGNHDDYIKNKRVLKLYGGEYVGINVFETVNMANELIVKTPKGQLDKRITLYHYPAQDWADRESTFGHSGYMFHGHVHGHLHGKRMHKRIDVGMDSALLYFGEYRPFELSEAIELSHYL